MTTPNLLSYTLLLADSLWIQNVSQQESSELVNACQFPVYNYCNYSFARFLYVYFIKLVNNKGSTKLKSLNQGTITKGGRKLGSFYVDVDVKFSVVSIYCQMVVVESMKYDRYYNYSTNSLIVYLVPYFSTWESPHHYELSLIINSINIGHQGNFCFFPWPLVKRAVVN